MRDRSFHRVAIRATCCWNLSRGIRNYEYENDGVLRNAAPANGTESIVFMHLSSRVRVFCCGTRCEYSFDRCLTAQCSRGEEAPSRRNSRHGSHWLPQCWLQPRFWKLVHPGAANKDG